MKPYSAEHFACDVCKPFVHKGSETGILLIHGFTGSVAHMRPLGDALFACGYTVMGINLPGHASTETAMEKVGHREWLQASLDALEALKKQCKTVAVCGLSMGAVLSLLLAERKLVDGCISISAPMPSANHMLPLTGILGYIIPRVSWQTDEHRKIQLDQRYDKGYSGFPTRKGGDLYRLIKDARNGLSQITCPTLVVQSTGDMTVDHASADTILDGIQSVQKRKLTLHDVPHVCTLSKKLPEIVDTIDDMMKTLE